jgi:hypothetical protein
MSRPALVSTLEKLQKMVLFYVMLVTLLRVAFLWCNTAETEVHEVCREGLNKKNSAFYKVHCQTTRLRLCDWFTGGVDYTCAGVVKTRQGKEDPAQAPETEDILSDTLEAETSYAEEYCSPVRFAVLAKKNDLICEPGEMQPPGDEERCDALMSACMNRARERFRNLGDTRISLFFKRLWDLIARAAWWCFSATHKLGCHIVYYHACPNCPGS